MCYFTQTELMLPSSPSDAAQCAIQGSAQMSLSWTALLAGYSELVWMRYIFLGTGGPVVILIMYFS